LEDDGPELLPQALPYWRAFCELSNKRAVGMALCPISMEAIDAYCRFFQIRDLEEKADCLRFLGALDREFLKIQAEKQKQEQEENRGSGRRRR
jgi:hypothetical protein